MGRPLWFVQLLKLSFLQRFQIAKLTKVPLVGAVIDHMLFEGDDIVYLPRDQVIEVGVSIDRPDNIVLPSQVVDYFINQASYHWVMNTCICRDASQCRDYPIDLGCLFLGEAVLQINPRLGRQVTREEALEHVRRCREAGLVHLVGRNKLDTVWLGVGPGVRLMTICNCCPCCCLWRILPHLASGIGAKVKRMPGVTLAVSDDCTGCGICQSEAVCFVDAIHVDGDRAAISNECRGCGRCVSVCPQGAIEMTVEHNAYIENAISELSELVDVT